MRLFLGLFFLAACAGPCLDSHDGPTVAELAGAWDVPDGFGAGMTIAASGKVDW